MKLAATVIYVEDVRPVLEFYRAAFGLEPRLVDLDVKLPERPAHGQYHYAILATEGGSLQFGTHDLGGLLMPAYVRPPEGRPAGVEIFFYAGDVAAAYERALRAGALPVAAPRVMPWGQTVAYVRGIEGTFIGIGSPLPE
jgi:predicted enzyme related to lactoylglutathione lyase